MTASLSLALSCPTSNPITCLGNYPHSCHKDRNLNDTQTEKPKDAQYPVIWDKPLGMDSMVGRRETCRHSDRAHWTSRWIKQFSQHWSAAVHQKHSSERYLTQYPSVLFFLSCIELFILNLYPPTPPKQGKL